MTKGGDVAGERAKAAHDVGGASQQPETATTVTGPNRVLDTPAPELLYTDVIMQHYWEMSHAYGDPAEFREAFPPPDGGIRSRCKHDLFTYGWTRTTRRCNWCGTMQRAPFPDSALPNVALPQKE